MLFVLANSMVAMEAPHKSLVIKTGDLQREIIPQSSHASTQKTLFEHFKIPSRTSANIQSLLAAHIMGPGGWYYKHAELKHKEIVSDMAFNAAGTQIATVAHGSVYVWDTENGDAVKKFDHPNVSVHKVLFHPQEQMVITSASDGNGYWCPLNTKCLNPRPEPFACNQVVNALLDTRRVDLCSQGDLLIRRLIGPEGTICLCDTKSGSIETLSPHVGTVSLIEFYTQEDILAAIDRSNTVSLWHIKEKRKLCTIAHDDCIFDMAFHPKERILAIAQKNEVCIRDFNGTLLDIRTFEDNISPYGNALAFHPQQIKLAVAGAELVALWDREYCHLLPHNTGVYGIAFNPQGTLLAVATKDGKIWLRNIYGALLRTLHQKHAAFELRFHPKGTMLATAPFMGGPVHLWQQHANPTLKQVLFRELLSQYYKECIENLKMPEVCDACDTMPLWMAQKFNIDKEELTETWQSIPEKLRKSIFNTLLYRAQHIKEVHAKYKAREQLLNLLARKLL